MSLGADAGLSLGKRSMGAEMAKLIYSAISSVDGYFEDAEGRFGWAAPDEEVHAFVNELERPIGTYLYGRPRRPTSPSAAASFHNSVVHLRYRVDA
jgi:hypothetical protein